jgi:dihydrofolate reductase
LTRRETRSTLVRKVLVSMMVTVDGMFAGPDGDIGWHNVDEEFNDFAIEQLDSVDTLLFGRVTYELMASYWPTDLALGDDPDVARRMNALEKVVFSRTLGAVEWENSRLVKDDLTGEVARLKEKPGKDMVIFGSGTIVTELAQAGLIDEYRLFINPVALGTGTALFAGLPEALRLKLVDTRVFNSGNVLLRYTPQS